MKIKPQLIRKSVAFALSAAMVTVLSACGSSSSGQTGGTAQITFKSVVDLKNAFVNAGGSCPTFVQNNQVTAALESADCGDSTVLSIYQNAFAAQQNAENVANILRNDGIDISIAYGANWVINGSDASLVAAKLGGVFLNQ